MTKVRRKNGARPENGIENGIGNGPVLKWHRTLGLAAALLVVFLSVTGVMLNHGPALDLDRRTTDSRWLLDWYGLGLKGEIVSYRAGDQWVTWSDNHLFLDGRAVAEHAARPTGVARSKGVIAAATRAEVFLLTPEGDLIERLTGAAVPGSIARMGVTAAGQVIVETDAGRFGAKTDFLGWTRTDGTARWSVPAPTPAPIRQKVLVDYRGHGLSWSRVLLDLHSGRLFGAWGPLVMDVTAIILVILAVTGLVNWRRRR